MILLLLSSISGMVLPPGYSLWLFILKPFVWCRSDARLWHFFQSPLCGVAQTPDCGISFKALYVVSLRRPTVALFVIYFIILILLCYCIFTFNMLIHTRVLFIIGDWRHALIIFSAHRCHFMPVFIMFASTFKVLTGLSLAIVLARFSCAERSDQDDSSGT